MKRKYPHFFIAILLIVILWTSPVLAEEDWTETIPGTDIKFTVTYSQDVVQLIVSGKGEIPAVDPEKGQLYLDDYARDEVKQIIIKEGITGIGDYAFAAFVNATKVTLPDTLKTIGNQSFMGLLKLKSINIPQNVNAIHGYAFYRCDSLEKFTVSGSNKTFSVKSGCLMRDGGTTLVLIPPVKTGEYTVPSGVKKIGVTAFSVVPGITDINIPASVTEIEMYDEYGNYIFELLSELKNVNVDSGNTVYESVKGVLYNKVRSELVCFPRKKSMGNPVADGTKIIGSFAFYRAREFSNMILPESLEEIHAYAFYGTNYNNGSLTIPKNVKTIEYLAFEGTTFDRFTVDEENQYFMSENWALLSKDKSILHAAGEGGRIPEGVRIIVPYAMTALEGISVGDVVFPEGLEYIGEGAYYGVTGISSVTFPETLKYIGDAAFYDATQLDELTFYENVEYIGASAFKKSSKLEKIVFYGNAPEITGADSEYYTFGNRANVCIFYDEEKSGWTNPEWQGYKSSPFKFGGVLTDTITWTLDLGKGTLTISGTGSIPDFGWGDTRPWEEYNAMFAFEELIVEDGITSIGSQAFKKLAVDKVILADSIEKIGDAAFEQSTLKRINIPDKVTEIGNSVFHWCEYLEEYPIGKNVVKIGNSAFAFHTGQVNKPILVIPASVKEIGYGAFSGASASTIVFEGVVEIIGEHAFADVNLSEPYDLVLPEGLMSMGKNAFFRVGNLRSVVVPSTCKVIPESCFSANTSITEITLSYGVEEIQRLAFPDDLEKIIIPGSVKTVAKGAFSEYYGKTAFYFNGDAPELTEHEYDLYREDVTLYYVEGREGWTSPEWNGYKTATLEGTEPITAEMVILRIDKIGEITFENREKVASVRKAYEALSDEEKAKVTNLDILVAAEAKVQEVINAKADEVIAMIASLGDDVITEKEKINAAAEAYEALGEYKSMVTNYDVLKAKLDELASYSVGDVNADGNINALDATQILRYSNGKSSVFTDLQAADLERLTFVADVNKDGFVNALDATQILRYANGKSSVIQ